MAGEDCPMCGAPGTERYRPFCSRRCADRDLGLWFTESYAVPSTDQEEFSESPPIAANDDD
jgi:endogenous inhibitor of DNA gyrase (YacG/DUF329 family)